MATWAVESLVPIWAVEVVGAATVASVSATRMECPQDIPPAQQNPVELVLSASDAEMVNRGAVYEKCATSVRRRVGTRCSGYVW